MHSKPLHHHHSPASGAPGGGGSAVSKVLGVACVFFMAIIVLGLLPLLKDDVPSNSISSSSSKQRGGKRAASSSSRQLDASSVSRKSRRGGSSPAVAADTVNNDQDDQQQQFVKPRIVEFKEPAQHDAAAGGRHLKDEDEQLHQPHEDDKHDDDHDREQQEEENRRRRNRQRNEAPPSPRRSNDPDHNHDVGDHVAHHKQDGDDNHDDDRKSDGKVFKKKCPRIPDPLPNLRRREEMSGLAERLGLKKGVELGVQRGLFSKDMLKDWPSCTEYWLVDIWGQQENYKDGANVDNKEQLHRMRQALNNTMKWKDKIRVCKNYTTECVKNFADGYFDFVFVDARHDYKGVSIDLKEWWPKIREGGLFAGHDYMWANESGGEARPGWRVNFDGTYDHTGTVVRGAVDDFFMSGNADTNPNYRVVQVAYMERAYNAWFVRK